MANAVKLSDKVLSEVQIAAKVQNRSVEGQVEHWIKIGKVLEENPDLTYELVKGILTAQQEAKAGLIEPYEFGD